MMDMKPDRRCEYLSGAVWWPAIYLRPRTLPTRFPGHVIEYQVYGMWFVDACAPDVRIREIPCVAVGDGDVERVTGCGGGCAICGGPKRHGTTPLADDTPIPDDYASHGIDLEAHLHRVCGIAPLTVEQAEECAAARIGVSEVRDEADQT